MNNSDKALEPQCAFCSQKYHWVCLVSMSRSDHWNCEHPMRVKPLCVTTYVKRGDCHPNCPRILKPEASNETR